MKTCLVLTFVAVLCVALVSAKSCPKAAKKAAKKGKPVPACDGNKFAAVQCPDTCFCADANSGKNLYKKFSFPSGGDFDCSSEPTECQMERFSKLAKGKDAPVCDENGDYPAEVPEKTCSKVAGTTNIALNKPTSQTSMGWGGVASRGVDGNKNPGYGGGSCTHTRGEAAADWWAVDLGAGTQVSSVAITKRTDACCNQRLNHMQIGLTDVDPSQSAPTLGSYAVCAQEPGAFGDAATRTFACEATGRFLVVQMQLKNYLTLCEVEVFGVEEVCE